MKRFFLCFSLLLFLLFDSVGYADTGLSETGWFDDQYSGFDISIRGTDYVVKVPYRWRDISFGPEMQIYQDGDLGIYFYNYIRTSSDLAQ